MRFQPGLILQRSKSSQCATCYVYRHHGLPTPPARALPP